MALNKYEIKLLKKARALLKSGEVDRVCYALDEAYDFYTGWHCDEHLEKARDRLEDYVMKQINPHSYFHHWQMAEGLFVSAEQARKDRINWISWMLGQDNESMKRCKVNAVQRYGIDNGM